MPDRRPCTYVTKGWGVHDDRWVAGLQASGLEVHTVSCERDGIDPTTLKKAVSGSGPILAGPLTNVTRELSGISNRLVGLSWGFDLIQMHNQDLSWLKDLDAIIVDSAVTRSIALSSGITPESVHTLPWGVDLHVFKADGPVMDLSNWNVPNESLILLSLRALEPIYRVSDILEAFAQIANSHPEAFLIVGNEGPLHFELLHQSRDLGIAEKVRFIGSVPESDVPCLLRTADVYITASEIDGTSVTLLQAMGCQIPVLASDTPGNRDWVIPRSTGRLFSTGDPTSLATGIREILQNLGTSVETTMVEAASSEVTRRANWDHNRLALFEILYPE